MKTITIELYKNVHYTLQEFCPLKNEGNMAIVGKKLPIMIETFNFKPE